MAEIIVRCYAKLNLTLEILRKRGDGYHDLSTIFQAVSLHDELRLTLQPVGSAAADQLQIAGLTVPVEGNLVLQAVEAYRREYGLDRPVALELLKRIPMGAGLGGGSSDAAGTLQGLASLTSASSFPGNLGKREHGSDQRLTAMAAALGSDVAFFLGGGTARGEGRGEVLEPLPTPQGWLVLAKPAVAVSTKEAYSLLSAADFTTGHATEEFVAGLRAGYSLHEMAPHLYNGFAAPIERRWPQIRVLREQLLTLGAEQALMTGSGAAVFGIFQEQAASEAAAAQLTADGYWAAAVCPVSTGLQVVDE